MSKVRILIIDSGVRVDHPHLKNDGIQGLTWDGGEMDSGIDDDFGHGTAVYGIIPVSYTHLTLPTNREV